jgi:tRNA 2-selenouridine synthase
LQGGYKTYRAWVLEQFEKDYPIQILGGYTGSGKTEVLKALAKKSECVIDLEGLAGHKGSAFGNMGLPAQPSQEMFENKLAQALSNTAPTEDIENSSPTCIWMEDESQRIGTVNIPTVLYQKMRQKKVFFLDIPFESRLDYICIHYGKFPKEQLINAIIRIKKKLGGLETKTAINSLVEDDVRSSFRVLLQYYDKLYSKGLERNRENLTSIVTRVEAPVVDDQANAGLLLGQQ